MKWVVIMNLKARKRILASILSITVPFGMNDLRYVSNNNEVVNSKENGQNTASSDCSFYENNPYNDLDLYEAKALMKQNLIQEFLDYYENLPISYYNVNIHSSKEEICTFLQNVQNKQQCDYVFDGKEEELIQTIQANSRDVANSNSKYVSIFEGENEDLSNFVFQRILSKIIAHSFNNVNEDLCRFQDLGIVFGNVNGSTQEQGFNIFTFIYNPEQNILVLDKEAMEKVAFAENITYPEEFEHVLLHGLNRARMFSCSIDQFYIPSAVLLEAASETELYYSEKDQTGYLNHFGNLLYYRKLNHEALLLLLGVFQENFSMEEYYRAICDSDVASFQSLFGLETKEDAVEFYHILESMDFVFHGNDYYNQHSQGLTLNDTIKEAGMGYRAKIFQKFLISMLHYKEKHVDFSLNDQLLFLAIARNLIIQDVNYYENDRAYCDLEFAKMIYDMEEQYISFLSQYYERSIDAIRYCDGENDSFIEDLGLFYREHRQTYKVRKLFEQYPVLSVICYESECKVRDYRRFLEENDFAMKRTIYQGDL